MNNTKKTRCLWLVTLWVLLSGIPAHALDPTQPASSLILTHFTTEHGLPGGVVDAAVQTKDGFLWLIVSGNNLVRYDGKNFFRFQNPRPRALAVAPGGDLWIGSEEGLIRIPSSNFNQSTLNDSVSYQVVPGRGPHIVRLHFSKSGILWIASAEGLFRYDGNQFVAVGPRLKTHEIKEAPDGHLFVFNETGLIEVAGSEILTHPKLAAQLGVSDKEIFDVLKDKHGNTWYCTAMGVARETMGRIEKLGPYGRGETAFRAYEDRQGTVWITKQQGLFRATSAGLELVAAEIQVRFLYTDRDGNLWVCTNGNGLYRYKERAVRMFTTADGLPNNLIMTVLAAHDGSVWTGANCGGITRFDGKHFQTYNEKNGLLNSCVYALAEDLNHDLWIGTWGGGAFRYHSGSFTQYKKAQGMADDRVFSILPARDGSIWFGTGVGLTRLKNEEFRNFTTADGLSSNVIFRVWEDRSGLIWVGNRLGLDRMIGDRFENVESVPKTMILPIGEDRDGGLFYYVVADQKATTRRVNKDRVDTIKQVGGIDIAETEHGELWICGTGFGRLQPSNFAQARPRDEPLDYESFSSADGLTTAEASGASRCFAQTTDGKLWAATVKGLAMFDLRHLPVTKAKPSIYLTDVTIGRNTQPAGREIVVPPGTSHVKIHFATVEISAPEKIRLQYRLDGVDSEWLDAPNDPSAIYTQIPVGTHALRVRACNRNGIWDRQGVVFMVTQQPFFYQTRWFISAMLALGVLMMVLVYRLRVAQISHQMSARFDERLAERTRVARELHDTLLQTVQGSKMVADHALKNSADHTRMVRAMEQLSTWLSQATEEGRAALHSLRASTTEKNDLAQSFRRAIDECGVSTRAEISFSVNGDSREIHPIVRDEIYRIGYEAIRNSCAHSGADRLEVTLEYAHDLTLRVSDNGVGIESVVIEQGKEGHFGLRGMRERAERIGSKFTLDSSADSGTVVTLVVPGRIAFRPAT